MILINDNPFLPSVLHQTAHR